MINSLFDSYDNIIVLDTETTGIDPKVDEIIELAAIRLAAEGSAPQTELDMFISLSSGRKLPPLITDITGITDETLKREGVQKEVACHRLTELMNCSNPLLVAYNAQFDLCFLFYFLQRCGCAEILKAVGMLDAMTVYKDRRAYPHKLSDAVAAYSLSARNTHRAIDDARATLELLCAMERERDDLNQYLNLFGYNPKYGVSGPKISSVKYVPQEYGSGKRAYECDTRSLAASK